MKCDRKRGRGERARERDRERQRETDRETERARESGGERHAAKDLGQIQTQASAYVLSGELPGLQHQLYLLF